LEIIRRAPAEPLRDGRVALLGSVLVDHRGTTRGVTSPAHHLGQRGPALRGEREARVPQVVDVHARQAGCLSGSAPGRVNVVGAQGAAVGANKDPGRGQGRSPTGDVSAEDLGALQGQVHGAAAASLGLALDRAAVGLHYLPGDSDRSRGEVDVADAQSDQFTEAQVAPEGRQHEGLSAYDLTCRSGYGLTCR